VQSDPNLDLMKDYKASIREKTPQARNSTLRKAFIEIDLLVDELRTRSTTPPSLRDLNRIQKLCLS